MWKIRAGDHDELIENFKEKNLVAIGYGFLKDLSKYTEKGIEKRIEHAYPNFETSSKVKIVNEIYNFTKEIKKNDYVASYDRINNKYMIGKVTSDYIFDENINLNNNKYCHIRYVDWVDEIPKEYLNDLINFYNVNVSIIKCKQKNDILNHMDGTINLPIKEGPKNIDLPFFAYGTLKSNQLAYYNIEKFVDNIIPYKIKGQLIIRDGIPNYRTKIEDNGFGIEGELIYFKKECSEEAYNTINKLKSKEYYKWETKDLKCSKELNTNKIEKYNILVDNNPCSQSKYKDIINDECSEMRNMREFSLFYDTQLDPFFKNGIEVIKEISENTKHDSICNIKQTLKLQMAYTLLWSMIERFADLKYPLTYTNNDKKDQFGGDDLFKEGLFKYVKENKSKRVIYATNNFSEAEFKSDDPIKAIKYYYTIRNNTVHRGKESQDFKILKQALDELTKIYEYVFNKSFK